MLFHMTSVTHNPISCSVLTHCICRYAVFSYFLISPYLLDHRSNCCIAYLSKSVQCEGETKWLLLLSIACLIAFKKLTFNMIENNLKTRKIKYCESRCILINLNSSSLGLVWKERIYVKHEIGLEKNMNMTMTMCFFKFADLYY